ncbi:MAG: small multi-drug export protein [Candidatus Omnitrophota bacterium]
MDISNDLLILLVSSLPIVELRGAIPLGIIRGMSVGKVFFLSVLGNVLVIIPLLLFFKWTVIRLEKIRSIGKILEWWFMRVRKKSKIVQAYGFWGLILFVAIPLPGTGAWTGAAAATLFNFKLPKAFLAIFLGVLIAGVLVTLGSLGIVKLWFVS